MFYFCLHESRQKGRGEYIVKNHNCSDRDVSFASKYDLKLHKDRVHLKIKPVKKVVCSECELVFRNNFSLGNHMNAAHLKIKP